MTTSHLVMRETQAHAKYKLDALKYYLHVTNTSMRDKWKNRCYIDLQAGPGKNRIGDTNEILLGSPLIALTAPHPSTKFFLNELNSELNLVLKSRISASPIQDRVKIFQGDVNEVVDVICDQLPSASLNLAFLDPEGLELHWSTVERLAKVGRTDMIINFSIMGIRRVYGTENWESLDHFFGTQEWREIAAQDRSMIGRNLIDFYRRRLEGFGYHIQIDPDIGSMEMSVKNSKNAELYRMIFASKHPLGNKFWQQSVKSSQPPKLPGFD
jgi:three-Cys-motif partner protein